MKRFRIAYILNLCLALLEVLAPIWMSSGLVGGVLTTSGAEMFKFFTIDSNVLMGVIALFTALQLRQVIRGQREDLSTACYVWYLAGTVGVPSSGSLPCLPGATSFCICSIPFWPS